MKHSDPHPNRSLLPAFFTALALSLSDARGEDRPEASPAVETLPACGSSWCAARHLPGSLPPWAQRIRDRGAAPAGADDGIWDPTTARETIDLLFLYTPTALAAEGSVAGIQRRIDTMLASANRVFDNSLTGVRIHLAHVAQVNQAETSDMVAAYSNFRNLPEVQTLRENYKADVVVLMVEQESMGFLGTADTTVPTGDARWAFAAIRRLDPSYREDMGMILAHEIAHLFGSAHDREHSYTANLVFNSSSATVNLDYLLPTTLSVSFAVGQSNATVQIPILQDDLAEGDESFRINLASIQGQHGLAPQSSLTVTIVDDEPSFTIVPGSSLIGEDGTADPAFDPGVGPSDHCYRLTALADGSSIVTGGFSSFGSQPAPGIARFRLPAFTGSFAGIQPGNNGVPTARIWGIPGSRLPLESSADLKSWVPVAETTVSTLDGVQPIALPAAADHQFFRIR